MAKTMKHIGKIKNTGVKVLVAFRTVPNESSQALVINAAQLPDSYHDSIMKLVETEQAQEAFEFGEIMFTRRLPDGRNMLETLQREGRLTKVPTENVVMNPTPTTEIQLDELNKLIADQRGVTVDTLYTLVSGAPKEGSGDTETLPSGEAAPAPASDGVLSDTDLARSLRSQADSLFKEASRMRKEADELDPPKKKTTKKAAAKASA